MATLKYWDAEAGEYKMILAATKGEKGDTGPQGPPGQDGSGGSLNQLSDVTVAPATPVGKYLGTTSEGLWGPVDPQDLSPYLLSSTAASTYLPLAGGTVTGPITLPAAPTADLEAATKKYVDDNIPAAAQNGWVRQGALNNQVAASGTEMFLSINSADSLNNVVLGDIYVEPQITGFWMIELGVGCNLPLSVTQRAFIAITKADSVDYQRFSIGTGESAQSGSGLMHILAFDRVYFKLYHEQGSPRNVGGRFTMKYLGPADL